MKIEIEITREKINSFNEKIAVWGSIGFFWFLLVSVGISAIRIFQPKHTYNPRIDEVYVDTIYANDSAYIVHKKIDSVYQAEDPNPPNNDDGN